MAEQKFRPYFTASELQYIIACVKSSSSPNMALVRYLESFQIKIERGILSPSLQLQPTMEEKLGFTLGEGPQAGLDPKILYMSWLSNPAERAKLSPRQLEIIQEYRYSNDLMSPTEESEYELALMQGA